MNTEYIAKLQGELKHARSQYRMALGREACTKIDMETVLPRAASVRRHALAIASCQKWLGAITRAKRSLAIMGVCEICFRPFTTLSGDVQGCATHGIR